MASLLALICVRRVSNADLRLPKLVAWSSLALALRALRTCFRLWRVTNLADDPLGGGETIPFM